MTDPVLLACLAVALSIPVAAATYRGLSLIRARRRTAKALDRAK